MSIIAGPIELTDKKNGRSEKTSGQVVNLSTYDSRLYPNYYSISYPVIRQLRKDPTIQLARLAVLAPMIHTPWMYKIRKNGSKEMAEFLEETFEPLRDLWLTSAVLHTLDYGWQPYEVIFKPEDGYIYVDEFKELLHDYTTILVYLNNGRFAGYLNEPYGYTEGQIIKEEYCLHTNFETEGTDWYGNSVYESLLSTINAWNNIARTAERYDRKIAGATWVVYYPVGKTVYRGVEQDNHSIALSILTSLEASGAIAVPDDIQVWLDDTMDREIKGSWRVDLVTATNSSDPGFINRQKYLDALKMRAFGLTERSLLEGSHGTKAEADVHGDVSLSIVDSRHRVLTAKLNLTIVPRLLALNFGKKYAYSAYIKPAPLVDTQFKTIKEIYSRIISDGDVLAAEVENIDMRSIRDELGIPTGIGLEIEKEEEQDGQLLQQ